MRMVSVSCSSGGYVEAKTRICHTFLASVETVTYIDGEKRGDVQREREGERERVLSISKYQYLPTSE